MRQKDALVDLDPILVALKTGALCGNLVAGWSMAGHGGGCIEHQVFDAYESREAVGQPLVERGAMGSEKPLAVCACRHQDRIGGCSLGGVAFGLRRQASEQIVGMGPEQGKAVPV